MGIKNYFPRNIESTNEFYERMANGFSITQGNYRVIEAEGRSLLIYHISGVTAKIFLRKANYPLVLFGKPSDITSAISKIEKITGARLEEIKK